jgi:hypothetical protein
MTCLVLEAGPRPTLGRHYFACGHTSRRQGRDHRLVTFDRSMLGICRLNPMRCNNSEQAEALATRLRAHGHFTMLSLANALGVDPGELP